MRDPGRDINFLKSELRSLGLPYISPTRCHVGLSGWSRNLFKAVRFTQHDLANKPKWSVRSAMRIKIRTPKPRHVAAQHELFRRSLLHLTISAVLEYSAHERPKIDEKKTSGVRYGVERGGS